VAIGAGAAVSLREVTAETASSVPIEGGAGPF
jgi:hypothetical protein